MMVLLMLEHEMGSSAKNCQTIEFSERSESASVASSLHIFALNLGFFRRFLYPVMEAPTKFRCCRIVCFSRARFVRFRYDLPFSLPATACVCAVACYIFRNEVIHRSEFHLSRIFFTICECALFRCLWQLSHWACSTKIYNFYIFFFFLHFFWFPWMEKFFNFFYRNKCTRRRRRRISLPKRNGWHFFIHLFVVHILAW